MSKHPADAAVREWYASQSMDSAVVDRMMAAARDTPAPSPGWQTQLARAACASAVVFCMTTGTIAAALAPPDARAAVWRADIVRLALAHPELPTPPAVSSTHLPLEAGPDVAVGAPVMVVHASDDEGVHWPIIVGLKVLDTSDGIVLETTEAQDAMLERALETGRVWVLPLRRGA